jgi:hypothetical protein
LFPEDKLVSDTVTQRLEDVLKFVLGPVINNDETLYAPASLQAFAYVNSLDVIQDVTGVIETSGSDEIRFKFVSPQKTLELSTGHITAQTLGHLNRYVTYLGEQYSNEATLDVSGRIHEMGSGNPKADRNRIVLKVIYEGAVEKLTAIVNTSDYHRALEAHGEGYQVRLTGKAKRMKTQLHMAKPDSFEMIVPEAESKE